MFGYSKEEFLKYFTLFSSKNFERPKIAHCRSPVFCFKDYRISK